MLRIHPVGDILPCFAALCVVLALSLCHLFAGIGTNVPINWTLHTTSFRLPELQVGNLHPGEGAESRDIQGDEGQRNGDALQLDYERRWERARRLGRRQPAHVFLRWLHIPKTGTSFVNTVLRWGCNASDDLFVVPRLERPPEMRWMMRETLNWDWLFTNESGRAWLREHCADRLTTTHPVSGEVHYALHMHRALTVWEIGKAVGMFRLPLQRMYSNYLHLNLHYNQSRRVREGLDKFVQKPKFWSQQAKLLLGRNYRDTRVLTEEDGRRAIGVIRRLRFVGLTEEFELSCRLFHAMFGGVPHRAQFENVRPGIHRYRTKEERSSHFRYDEREFGGWRDPVDHAVYEEARRRFWADVRAMRAEIEHDGLGPVVVNA